MSAKRLSVWRYPLLVLGAGLLVTTLIVFGVTEIIKREAQPQNRLINVSARGMVGPGADSLLVGFVVEEQPQTLVVRGLGPSLAREGGPPALPQVLLRVVRNADGVDVGRNSAWRSPGNERLWGDLKHLALPHAAEAACILTLAPGSYAALIESPNAQRGLASIEVFVVRE